MEDALDRTAAVYRFDRFSLDLHRGVLLGADGKEIPLRPKSFALRRTLVQNAGKLLDHDALMAAVWPGVFVTDESIAQCVKDVRRALGDERQRLIRTVVKRGYVLNAEVTNPRTEDNRIQPVAIPSVSPAEHAAPPPALGIAAAPRLSLVVLPFDYIGGNESEAHLADAITESPFENALRRARGARRAPASGGFSDP